MSFDQQRSEAFADRMMGALNEAALCLMTSIGHRTGLFDVMAELPPSKSQKIAEKAGLNERYVREWLGALVTADVVEFNGGTGEYRLPKEHAALLTRGAEPNNLAVFAQYIPVLSYVEDDILDCFRSGGGLPYSKYPRFHSVMEEDSAQTVLAALLEEILPLDPTLPKRLAEGMRVLDLGCGRGRALNLMARTYPKSQFVGYELSEETVQYAVQKAASEGLENVRFSVRDLSHFDEDAPDRTFDLITTFDAVHDQAKPLRLLRGIARALKTDGTYLMQDIRSSVDLNKNRSHPAGTLLYTISCLHCMSVSLAQAGGEGWGAMWGEERALDYLGNVGFSTVEVHKLTHDFQNNYYICKL